MIGPHFCVDLECVWSTMICLPVEINRVGAILGRDKEVYQWWRWMQSHVEWSITFAQSPTQIRIYWQIHFIGPFWNALNNMYPSNKKNLLFLTGISKKKCLHIYSRKYHNIPSDTKLLLSRKGNSFIKVFQTSISFEGTNTLCIFLHLWIQIRLYYIPYMFLYSFCGNSLVFGTIM